MEKINIQLHCIISICTLSSRWRENAIWHNSCPLCQAHLAQRLDAFGQHEQHDDPAHQLGQNQVQLQLTRLRDAGRLVQRPFTATRRVTCLYVRLVQRPFTATSSVMCLYVRLVQRPFTATSSVMCLYVRLVQRPFTEKPRFMSPRQTCSTPFTGTRRVMCLRQNDSRTRTTDPLWCSQCAERLFSA